MHTFKNTKQSQGSKMLHPDLYFCSQEDEESYMNSEQLTIM